MKRQKQLKNSLWKTLSCLLLAATLLLSGCASPVGVRHLDSTEANQKLTENVLSDESLSAPTKQILNRSGLAEQFQKDPAAAIQALRAGVPTASKSDLFFALAELSFLHATQTGEQSYYLAATVYAYAFLFPKESSSIPDPFDPRLMLAVDLYNQGIALGFTNQESKKIAFKTDTYKLPFGELKVYLDPADLRLGPSNMVDFVAASKLEVRGLRNDYSWPGIGSAMVASLQPIPGEKNKSFALVPPTLKVAVTAFLRLDNIEEYQKTGKLNGQLNLYTNKDDPSATINGRKVPLGFRPTSALAYTLEGAKVYDFELKGLISGDVSIFEKSSQIKDNIFLMAPYEPGRIPLVLVHGTASSPARWAQLINEIINDRELSKGYQIWLFTYNTGNPILYSSGILAQGLRNLVKEFDPEGKDKALREMVVIGHSQGGMLTKMTAIDSGDRLWNPIFKVPLNQLETTPESREMLNRSFFYKPLPFVKQVIFISTPHRGSYLAKNWVADLLRRVIDLPFTILSPLQEIFLKNQDAVKLTTMKTVPRSTDNMNPNSEFVKNYSSIPLAPGIKAHSIIAVNNPKDPKDKWEDGVVAYKSAHIEGVESEFIALSGHSAQDNPEAIEEVRRILLEHLQQQKRK